MSVSTTKKLYGKMYGVGWHQSMELGKTLSYYAPNSCSEETITKYEELLEKLPAVADMFKTQFCYLFPAGAKSLIETSREGRIPSFDDFLDGNSKAQPFSNCLTLTNDDFSNFQYRDKDHIAVAFGLWWTSARDFTSEGKPVYSFQSDKDHDEIDGGGFLWGEYGIGVDFQHLLKLILIGKHDFHSTMLSDSPEGATRWGTSVQLTQRGVNAVSKFWQLDNFERAFTPQECIQMAYKKNRKKTTGRQKAKAKAAVMKQMMASIS
ncbi:uncharacterized protein LACBIDRAFT_334102 [Laccaria bicolor S238N-H82]|uniref:Predicted protein n=1 Tax=Laccaria bicolor (strain S238N-H82 / ATCC MYA-4686) TaxID=486041 RepID=B0DY34_LACBS|nr:uncharacterized protein LACBIDRAFT_334102 [Laccaria bicolor S238N-H82]EDR00494.1 predicted protein [Laccaria bicolor S238N-H82]|eukprot:XP_001888886.1 predicted protein [Laccaria bicolor S238N-H82]